jgi:hypothetical protein
LSFLNCLSDIWRDKITVPYAASGLHASTKTSFKQFSASSSTAKQRSDDSRTFRRSTDEGISLKESYSKKWRPEKGSTKKGNKGGGNMAGGSEEAIFRHLTLGKNQSSSDRSRRKVLLRKQVLFINTSDHLMV